MDMHDGEPDSFTAAFGDLYARAVRQARRFHRDQSIAEDLAAEAMTRAYMRWDRIGVSTAYCTGWVLRTVTNLSIDLIREKKRQAEPLVREMAAPQDAQDRLTWRLTLVGALRELPHRQRQVLTLRYFAGMSYAEVASALDINAGSVARHVHRGLAGLRVLLDEPRRRHERLAGLSPGEIHRGVVRNVVPFGAFVELSEAGEEVYGLVHSSEIGRSAAESADLLAVGQVVSVEVLVVDAELQRLSFATL